MIGVFIIHVMNVRGNSFVTICRLHYSRLKSRVLQNSVVIESSRVKVGSSRVDKRSSHESSRVSRRSSHESSRVMRGSSLESSRVIFFTVESSRVESTEISSRVESSRRNVASRVESSQHGFL